MNTTDTTPTAALAALDRQLAILHDRKNEAKMILDVLEQPLAFRSSDVITRAMQAASSAKHHGHVVEHARALMQLGIAHLSLWDAREGTGTRTDHRAAAAADLERACALFRQAEAEQRAELQRHADRLKKRDKARGHAPGPGPDRTAELRAAAVQAALARARCARQANTPEEELRWFRKALELCADVPLHGPAADARGALGQLYRASGDPGAAIVEYREELRLRRRADDTEGAALALAHLAEAHGELGELEEALEYVAESWNSYERAESGYALVGEVEKAVACRYRKVALLCSEARIRLARHEAVAALELAVRTLEGYYDVARSVRDTNAIPGFDEELAGAHLVAGRAHEALGQLEPALDRFAEAYTIAAERCPRRVLLPILLQVGRVQRLRGDIADAVGALTNALAIAEAESNAHMCAQLHRHLAETHKDDHQYERALEHLERFVELQAEAACADRRATAAIQRVRFDTEQRELETDALRQRNALLEDKLAYFVVTVGLDDDEAAPAGAGRRPDTQTVDTTGESATPVRRGSAKKWVYFKNLLDDLYPGFLDKLHARAPRLTRTHMQVCALMRLGISNEEVAQALRVKPRTLESHRNDIRKRLPGVPCDDLLTWMLNVTADTQGEAIPPVSHSRQS